MITLTLVKSRSVFEKYKEHILKSFDELDLFHQQYMTKDELELSKEDMFTEKTLTTYFEEIQDKDNIYLFVIMKDDIPIGIVGCDTISPQSLTYEVAVFSILEPYRHQGISKLVFELLTRHCKKLKRKYMGLYVVSENISAINAYKKNGFKIRQYRMLKQIT